RRRENAAGIEEILEAERNAVQGPAIAAGLDLGFSLLRLLSREIGGDGDESIELRIDRVDALEVRFDELDRRELALANEIRELSNGEKTEFFGHARELQ